MSAPLLVVALVKSGLMAGIVGLANRDLTSNRHAIKKLAIASLVFTAVGSMLKGAPPDPVGIALSASLIAVEEKNVEAVAKPIAYGCLANSLFHLTLAAMVFANRSPKKAAVFPSGIGEHRAPTPSRAAAADPNKAFRDQQRRARFEAEAAAVFADDRFTAEEKAFLDDLMGEYRAMKAPADGR